MKKIFLTVVVALTAALAATPAFAQQAPTKAAPGTETVFVVKDAKGKVQSYLKSVVDAVNETDAMNYSVTTTVTMMGDDRQPMMDPITTTARVVNGQLDMSSMLPPMPPEAGKIKIEGTLPPVHPVTEVGQEDAFNITTSAEKLPISFTIEGVNRVIARESVVVPAGTFECFRNETEMTVKAMMMAQSMKTISWSNDEVGSVKSETYNERGKLETVTELISIKRP
ncbi:MAG: hypothetical protein LBV18_07455 [Alistipes sp.]|jgi:hypothetical protein|nr:hypothetical protein [Alistipes sp.]